QGTDQDGNSIGCSGPGRAPSCRARARSPSVVCQVIRTLESKLTVACPSLARPRRVEIEELPFENVDEPALPLVGAPTEMFDEQAVRLTVHDGEERRRRVVSIHSGSQRTRLDDEVDECLLRDVPPLGVHANQLSYIRLTRGSVAHHLFDRRGPDGDERRVPNYDRQTAGAVRLGPCSRDPRPVEQGDWFRIAGNSDVECPGQYRLLGPERLVHRCGCDSGFDRDGPDSRCHVAALHEKSDRG